jgi:hypothetical protein
LATDTDSADEEAETTTADQDEHPAKAMLREVVMESFYLDPHSVEQSGYTVKTYSCFGDLGDLIYALPVVRGLGAGELVLYPSDRCREMFTPDKVARITSFFLAQPYITGVRYAETPEGTILDEWRQHWVRGRTIMAMMLTTFGLPDNYSPWLTVEPKRVAACVMNRTARYHGKHFGFSWKQAVRKHTDAVFVGAKEEHQAFVKKFGKVPYHETPTLMDLAQVIAGADLFVGNQSTPLALAHGLGKRVWVEEHERSPDCHINRAGACYGRRAP